nr:hypothetical protein Iba_chr10eCG4390 [Ipomoea batatas]
MQTQAASPQTSRQKYVLILTDMEEMHYKLGCCLVHCYYMKNSEADFHLADQSSLTCQSVAPQKMGDFDDLSPAEHNYVVVGNHSIQ